MRIVYNIGINSDRLAMVAMRIVYNEGINPDRTAKVFLMKWMVLLTVILSNGGCCICSLAHCSFDYDGWICWLTMFTFNLDFTQGTGEYIMSFFSFCQVNRCSVVWGVWRYFGQKKFLRCNFSGHCVNSFSIPSLLFLVLAEQDCCNDRAFDSGPRDPGFKPRSQELFFFTQKN